jgi:hypothetical protein
MSLTINERRIMMICDSNMVMSNSRAALCVFTFLPALNEAALSGLPEKLLKAGLFPTESSALSALMMHFRVSPRWGDLGIGLV